MHQQLLKEIELGSKNALIKKKFVKYYIYNGSATITDLSKELGLSVPTVTKFISEMCEEGYINDYGKLETSGGRHPSLYGLNPASGYFIGVDIKKFSVNIGIINFKGDMVEQKMGIPYRFENTSEALEELCRLIGKFISKTSIDTGKILNININISGRVNPESGYSFSQFNFSERPLAEILTEKLGFQVCIDNDTRAMTYGEFLQGCVKGEKNVIFVNVSWGLGIGIIIDGKIYNGKSGFSGEFGHIHAFDNEILCHCGKKGCLETQASGVAMHRILLERIGKNEKSILSNRVASKETPLTLDEIIEAVNKEDMLCIEIIEEIGQELGKHIAGLINLFNPEMVIIGGTLSLADDYLIQPIKTAIKKYSLNLVNKDSIVTASKLKERAGVVGACLLARSRMFED
ncbi:ROK family transcriptional regulator [Bacteroides sp. KG68]|uniref:ROK family transcriptional regulator n=1 Tax=unclassified Bacteroides TaxID=2646097 RepID=UPI003D7F42CC